MTDLFEAAGFAVHVAKQLGARAFFIDAALQQKHVMAADRACVCHPVNDDRHGTPFLCPPVRYERHLAGERYAGIEVIYIQFDKFRSK
jgi:hypothetical protein